MGASLSSCCGLRGCSPYRAGLVEALTHAHLSTRHINTGGRSHAGYEPLLLEQERDAVADLLNYLESACRSL